MSSSWYPKESNDPPRYRAQHERIMRYGIYPLSALILSGIGMLFLRSLFSRHRLQAASFSTLLFGVLALGMISLPLWWWGSVFFRRRAAARAPGLPPAGGGLTFRQSLAAAGRVLGVGVNGEAVSLPPAHGEEHILLVGATQSGKSTLAARIALPEKNRSLLVIDPHNSLTYRLLAGGLLNTFNNEDIFPLWPGEAWAPGWNLLQALAGETAQACAQRFTETAVDLFFGGNLIEAQRFQEHTFYAAWSLSVTGWSAAEIEPFLSNPGFRGWLYPQLEAYPDLQRWISRFNQQSKARQSDMIASTVSRMRLFRLGEAALIFGQRRSTLNLERFLRSPQAVWLAPLASDLLSQSGAYLAAGLLLSTLDSLLARREKEGAKGRVRIVADEFQRYAGASLERLLAERRGYGASLLLVTQGLEQLSGSQRSALLNNIGPLGAFRLSAAEAQLLSPELFYPAPTLPRQYRSSGDAELYAHQEALSYYADRLKRLPPRHFYWRLPQRQAQRAQALEYRGSSAQAEKGKRRIAARLQAVGRLRREVEAELAERERRLRDGDFGEEEEAEAEDGWSS